MKNKRKDIRTWIICGIVLFGLIITPSCTKLPTPEERMQERIQAGRAFAIPDGQDTRYVSVKHFEYDGHKYIQFGDCNNRSIVHDPDCPCNND